MDAGQPRLSWILQETSPGLRSLGQSAYEVRCASSRELLDAGRADLWDSQKVSAARTIQISYDGKPLESFESVYWTVRVWDQDGKVSEWSPPGCWKMGILNPSDWKNARWLSAPLNSAGVGSFETVLLRGGFDAKRRLKRAMVYVCGLGQYEMTLNGHRVGDAVLAPGWTVCNKTCLYDTYDITSLINTGPNVAGLFLGNGFFNNHRYPNRYLWLGGGSYGSPQAICLLRLEYADGTFENVVTDENWRTSAGPITTSSVYGGEDCDARLEQTGWDRPGFSDSSWVRPSIGSGPGGMLRGITGSAPPIRVLETLKPVGARRIAPNVIVYDLGQNAAIMARFKVRGRAGATVKVIPSELVSENGEINDRMCGGKSYCVYTLRGAGEETCQWKFYYRGARYLRVQTSAGPGGGALPSLSDLQGLVIRSDAPVAGQFSCSNALVNKIDQIVRRAQMSNMMSVMTDCPTREKFGYLEEDHLNGPALRYNFDLNTLFTKTVNDMADSQTGSGLVPSRAPDYYRWDENFVFNTPMEWGSACILIPWQQYEFSADIQMIQNRYSLMKRYMKYLDTKTSNNTVHGGLGDWYDNLSEGQPTLTPVELTDTAFYCQDYRILSKIAAALGQKEDAATFDQRADAIADSFNKAYFNPLTNNYAKGAQGSNCLPLAMNIADPARRAAILENLVKDLQAKRTNTGEVSFRYLLRALAEGGKSDLIYKLYTSETDGYGLQVKLGKTSLTEAWNGGNASQNHFMFGQINEWYYHDLAGIGGDPQGPGFEKIIIKPAVVGDLTWVKASYRSIHGEIVSDWTHAGDHVTMHVVIPPGTTATIDLPAKNPAGVTEGGKPLSAAPGLAVEPAPRDRVVVHSGSGDFHFEIHDEN